MYGKQPKRPLEGPDQLRNNRPKKRKGPSEEGDDAGRSTNTNDQDNASVGDSLRDGDSITETSIERDQPKTPSPHRPRHTTSRRHGYPASSVLPTPPPPPSLSLSPSPTRLLLLAELPLGLLSSSPASSVTASPTPAPTFSAPPTPSSPFSTATSISEGDAGNLGMAHAGLAGFAGLAVFEQFHDWFVDHVDVMNDDDGNDQEWQNWINQIVEEVWESINDEEVETGVAGQEDGGS